MPKKCVLLITCSVGYGHQAAAMNVEEALRVENPDLEIIRLNTRDYFPAFIGKLSDQWDSQMRKGHFSISQIVNIQGPYEAFYEKFLDSRLSEDMNQLLKDHPISEVYDTQPMFTPIFAKAISKASRNGIIFYHKILTDLPTPRNSSFFTGIWRAKKEGTLSLRVHAPEPMLKSQETAEAFWQKHCGISADQLEQRFAFPVHPDYLNLPKNPHSLAIKTEYPVQLPPEAFVTTLMLGSQGVNAIYDYALAYLNQIEVANPSQPHYFFIACSKNQALFDKLQTLLDSHPLHRDTAHRIIPLTMQTMDAVASLMWRSNQVIIRSGGISSIEQLALAKTHLTERKLWIHSAYKGQDAEGCLGHTYAWERGNAEYLMSQLGAEMTAPQLIRFFG